jgi:very-short-patch-repair endonuclease
LRVHFPTTKFRRQHPVGRRTADFTCPAARSVIAVDGGRHGDRSSAEGERTAELAEHGYRVIRFWNGDAAQNLNGVLETISRALRAAPTSPGLSAPEGGEER